MDMQENVCIIKHFLWCTTWPPGLHPVLEWVLTVVSHLLGRGARALLRVVTAPSAGCLEKPGHDYLDTARAVTAGLVLLGFPVKEALTSSSRHRARFFPHLWPVESVREDS